MEIRLVLGRVTVAGDAVNPSMEASQRRPAAENPRARHPAQNRKLICDAYNINIDTALLSQAPSQRLDW
ncbi:hypothetical protein CCR91_02760 [Thiorhodovibrio winogradskyi]|nr:hypothetical protein [Thiorhodovibrio winogradskyi]